MAKWNAQLAGSGGHIHQSVWRGGDNLFAADDTMMRHYVAGLVEHLPSLIAITCPTINSYKRLTPGFWSPIASTWGCDNRTAAVRVLTRGEKGPRIELRAAGADMNPYLAMAASVAAGMDGVLRKLHPPEATANGYSTTLAHSFPRNLLSATQCLESSSFARDWLGEEFVNHYCATRHWEIEQFDRAVTDWEVNRYFHAV
jgi:glutamine synthetase